MADIQISVEAGTQTRLLTAGKYCKDDILVTASGGIGDGTTINGLIDGTLAGDYTNNEVSSIRQNAFNSFRSLKRVFFGKAHTVNPSAFQNSDKLEVACFLNLSIIGQNCFCGCSSLYAFVLKNNAVCELYSVNAFSNTKIAYKIGYIYVPDDLVDQYKVATNWATYASQIKGLSEIPAEVQEWLDQQGGAA